MPVWSVQKICNWAPQYAHSNANVKCVTIACYQLQNNAWIPRSFLCHPSDPAIWNSRMETGEDGTSYMLEIEFTCWNKALHFALAMPLCRGAGFLSWTTMCYLVLSCITSYLSSLPLTTLYCLVLTAVFRCTTCTTFYYLVPPCIILYYDVLHSKDSKFKLKLKLKLQLWLQL